MSTSLREASWYEPAPAGRVRCTLCPHRCVVADGVKGACGVRVHRGGKLYTLVYDRVVARSVEPIEKKPFFHFLPGSLAYSIATVGCNLRCAYCQNWEISQWPKEHLPRRLEWETDAEPASIGCSSPEALGERIPGERVTPAEIVEAAVASGARSIAYTYTEPTIFFELAYDTAVLARKRGLRNVFVTNGFISEGPLRQIAEVLDAANVDLKFFRDESYRRVSRVRLAPILEAIRLYHALGVWTEVTTLVVPGLNDSDEELRRIAEFVCSVDPAMPWHVSRFYPAWRMLDRPSTPLESLHRAREIGAEAGLRFVYEGNVPGGGGEDTRCPRCGALLIRRYGLTLVSNRIADAGCPECGERIEGEGMRGSLSSTGEEARPSEPRAVAGLVTRDRFDAVLFDLDGVLTDTASLHASCWKAAFDPVLERWAEEHGEDFRPFDVAADYLRHVDGRSRLDGVRSFLAARSLVLPERAGERAGEGAGEAGGQGDSVEGIARDKDERFERALRKDGVTVYEGSVRWLRHVHGLGLRTAVVSASHHCQEVLGAVGIEDLFDARVDGTVADELGLAGKPAPDAFLRAARLLGVSPARAVVIEDALAGVEAGRAGGFGLVVGVARGTDPQRLQRAGADVVVRDLAELLP
jgi:pyruvate formate lyase activating enzyme